jgi:hypothetical protein
MADNDEEKPCAFIKRKRLGAIRVQEPTTQAQVRQTKVDDKYKQSFRAINDNDDDQSDSSEDDDELDAEQKEMLTTQKRELLKTNYKTSVLSQSTKSQKKFRKLADEKIDDAFKADRTDAPVGPRDMGATATYNIDMEKDRDARSIFERAKQINDELKAKDTDDKVYRGINNYQQFYEKRDTVQGFYTWIGMPRVSTIFDFLIFLCVQAMQAAG